MELKTDQKQTKKKFLRKFPAVMRQNQVNNQQQRLIKSTRKYQYDSVGKSTILGIFATNLGSKWGPKSTEKCQKMSFLWKFS